MRRRLLAALLALLPVGAVAGCGTAAFESRLAVTVDGGGDVLGSDVVRVSVFDTDGGSTRDWAERSLGTASPGVPYTATVTTVETRMVGSGGPASRVKAGLYLPDYRELGWYSLDLQPVEGTTSTVPAPFVAWDGYGPQAAGVPALPMEVTATARGDVWELAVSVTLSGARPDETPAAPSPSASSSSTASSEASTKATASPGAGERDRLTQELIRAAGRGDDDAVDRLLLKGAEINGTDDRGRTPVIAAAYANEVETARLLVQRGADVNLKDETVQSAYLISTSEVGPDDALLVVMLNGGARMGSLDSFDGTGLIRAAERGYPDIVRRLLVAGTEVDHVNNLGWTALHEAIILGECTKAYAETVQLLVDGGADVNKPSARDGVRPLAHARAAGCAEVERILVKAGARP